MDKKLYVLSVGVSEMCLVGGYMNDKLFIKTLKPVNSRGKGFEMIRAEMQNYKKRGFLVVVSEAIPRLSVGFNRFSLAESDNAGQPKLVAAMVAYQHLSRRKMITFDKSVRRVSIPENVYEKEVSDKGVVTFRIDWDGISEDALALLITVYNCVYHTTTESTFLKSVFSNLNSKRVKPRFSPIGRL